MNAKVEQKDRSHESILESASRLLREKGIAGARVAEVMKGAGLTVGGFYAHFASKEALIDETIRRTGALMRATLFSGLEEKPREARAEVVLKRYLSSRHRDESAAGCALPAIVGEVGTTAHEHREALIDHVAGMVSELEPHLPASGPIPRRALALGLVAMMYGGLSLARAARGTELSDEILKACRALGKLALRGDAPR
jgi:TetR/AcrR family transcriptional regulator, transcriptional repressor for nem operon